MDKYQPEEEHPRPEYIARLHGVEEKTVNFVTQTTEPRVPFWSRKFPGWLLCFAVNRGVAIPLFTGSGIATEKIKVQRQLPLILSVSQVGRLAAIYHQSTPIRSQPGAGQLDSICSGGFLQ